MKQIKLKEYLAIASFIASICFGVAAFTVPPLGIIDPSVLWWLAQLLCFSATLLGFSMTIDNLKQKIEGGKYYENDRKDI